MFLFKKIVSALLSPLSLCLEALFVGLWLLWFTRRQRAGKMWVTGGVVALTLLSYSVFVNLLVRPLEKYHPPLDPQALLPQAGAGPRTLPKWIVVLGGGHTSDTEIPITSRLSEPALVRLTEAVRLYRQLPGIKMIVSGGKVFDPVPEAETMAQVAAALGVRDEDLVLETGSMDTEDQARLIQRIVATDPFILVTSASHMPRSMALFRKRHMDPIPAPTGHLYKRGRGDGPGMFFPNAHSLEEADRAFHELLGLVHARLFGKI